MVDLTALQTAVDQLKTEVNAIAPSTGTGGDDQAAVDALTTEVESLVAELSSTSSTVPVASPAPSPSSSATDAPAGGTAAWTPPGS